LSVGIVATKHTVITPTAPMLLITGITIDPTASN
jgi:hypothetical protein